jgi:hypothetical protein
MSKNPFYYTRSIGGPSGMPQHLVVVDPDAGE